VATGTNSQLRKRSGLGYYQERFLEFGMEAGASNASRLLALSAPNGALKVLPIQNRMGCVSATEILDELPRLTPAELEIIYRRAVELHQGQTLEASPQLLAAIDAADESADEGVSIGEARRIAGTWNTK
jgi:hypothetical protein